MEVYHFGLEMEPTAWKSTFSHNNSICYFGVWQLKAARGRSDFPVTPTIYFIHLPMCLYFSQYPKLHVVTKLLQHLPASRKRGLPSSPCPSHCPVPSAPFHPLLLMGPVRELGQPHGLEAQGQKRMTGEKAGAGEKIPFPFDGSEISSCQSHKACSSPNKFPIPWVVKWWAFHIATQYRKTFFEDLGNATGW